VEAGLSVVISLPQETGQRAKMRMAEAALAPNLNVPILPQDRF
jgi:hypothetical protein